MAILQVIKPGGAGSSPALAITRITGEWLPWLWLALILSHSVVY
jgi:hypothetical protein